MKDPKTTKAAQRLPVTPRTLRQAQILRAVSGRPIVEIAAELFEAKWRAAVREGIVTEKMIETVQDGGA